MLASFRRLRSLGSLSGSTIKTLSSTNTTPTSQHFESKSRKLFPDDNVKQRIFEEYEKSRKRVLTVPNMLTFSRIATAPAIGYFIMNGMNKEALCCFAFAATTDFLDGFIARRFKQESDFGTMIDPIADKLLLTTCFVSMYQIEMMPFWLVKGVVARDVLIIFGATVLRYFGFEERPSLKKFFDFKNYPTLGFEPTYLSKFNTLLQCVLIVTHLSTGHLAGSFAYDYSLFGLQLIVYGTSLGSLAQYAARALHINTLMSKAPKTKG